MYSNGEIPWVERLVNTGILKEKKNKPVIVQSSSPAHV